MYRPQTIVYCNKIYILNKHCSFKLSCFFFLLFNLILKKISQVSQSGQDHRLYKNMDVVSVTSPVGFCKAFLKPKVGGADRRNLGKRVTTRHSRIIENGQKGGTWVELVAETTPT